MLTLRLTRALADAVKAYAELHLEHRLQHVTTLNVASRLFGYQHHRQARAALIAGDEPMLTASSYGQTFLARAEAVLTHLHQQRGHPDPSASELASFARAMVIAHDASLWSLVDQHHHLSHILDSGPSTVIADPRPWLSIALQRALTQELGNRHGLDFGVIDHAGFYSAGLPQTHPLPSGAEFHFSLVTPNIFFRARVDHSTPRLALPLITPAILTDYDAYIMHTCHSVHAVYLSSPEQAALSWGLMCHPYAIREHSIMVGISNSQLTVHTLQ